MDIDNLVSMIEDCLVWLGDGIINIDDHKADFFQLTFLMPTFMQLFFCHVYQFGAGPLEQIAGYRDLLQGP